MDEAGTGMLSKVLGFTTAVGVTLAIVRKARDIFWSTVGIALMVRKGLSIGGAVDTTEEVLDQAASDAKSPNVQQGRRASGGV